MTEQWFNFYSRLLYLIIDRTFTLVVFINHHYIITKLFFPVAPYHYYYYYSPFFFFFFDRVVYSSLTSNW